MSKIFFSREELEGFAKANSAFHGLDISRISSIFIYQVYRYQENRVIDVFRIMDEVKYLEGIKKTTSTGAAKPFTGKILKGLCKKHYTDAGFIEENISVQCHRKGRVDRLCKIVGEAFEKGRSYDEIMNYIAHYAYSVGVYEERRAKLGLTGEWIVFKKHEGLNYYLTLAEHKEGDENISSRVKATYKLDYPFLEQNV